MLRAEVRISFKLHRSAESIDNRKCEFPISHPLALRLKYRVRVDGKLVETTTRPLIQLDMQQWRNEHAGPWKERVESWIDDDPELSQLVDRYRQLDREQADCREAITLFEERIRSHLIDVDEVRLAAVYVAQGDPFFPHLIKLMPEIDPGLRIDEPYARWKYISLLQANDRQQYRRFEKEWRRKAEAWFSEKPEIAELLPALRRHRVVSQQAKELSEGPMLKHLQQVHALSSKAAEQFTRYLSNGSAHASVELAIVLIPECRQAMQSHAAAITEQLASWGLDEAKLNPATGSLEPVASDQRGWFNPGLVAFDSIDASDDSIDVEIEFETSSSYLRHPLDATGFLTDLAPEELQCVFPAMETVPVTVTIPAKVQPIISPPPKSVVTLDNGKRRFDLQLAKGDSVLHLVSVPFDRFGNPYLAQFRLKDSDIERELQTHLKRTENLTTRPMLLSVRYMLLLQNRQLWLAHQLGQSIAREHPDFADCFESLQSASYLAKAAKEQFEWIEKKSVSPELDEESDLVRFRSASANDTNALSKPALDALARRVLQLDESTLTLPERMGRRFILCQAGDDVPANLSALIDLAQDQPESIVAGSLKLIQFLTIDKSAALPYVIRQTRLWPKAEASRISESQRLRRNAACHALTTFRARSIVPQLIEFIESTDDALLIQAAMDSLGHMTLPNQFDALATIAARVIEASESATIKYLQLLIRSDREKAVATFNDLRKTHPAVNPLVMRILADAGETAELADAISLYTSSLDIRDELYAAIRVMTLLADGSDVARLKYRHGLPQWMNQSLVSIIARRGADGSAFPFVEAYYLEFVQGKAKFSHRACVAAFRRIGDDRALPYLHDILRHVEQKTTVAEAIGWLRLNDR